MTPTTLTSSASFFAPRSSSLEAAGFATRDHDGRYVPGPELLRIARSLATTATLPRLAEPSLRALAERTGESAYLAEPVDGSTAAYVAMHEGSHTVRHVSWLGHVVPRRSTAVGAALAGRVDDDGVAMRVAAVEDGTTAVSAPVRDATGTVIAALSVVGPSYRFEGVALRTARTVVATSVSMGPKPGPTIQPTQIGRAHV